MLCSGRLLAAAGMEQLILALAFSAPQWSRLFVLSASTSSPGPPTPPPPRPPPHPHTCAASGGARRADFLPHADEVWWRAEPDGGLTLIVKSGFDQEAVDKAGAPQALWTEVK